MGDEQDEDPFASWQENSSYPTFPSGYIECPLTQKQLEERYSLTHVAPMELEQDAHYGKQEEALESFSLDPPLTKAMPHHTNPHKRKAKHNMRPISHPTLETRVRTLREFVGFAFKWLDLVPTMELVLHPQVVAKFFGFHVAKGTQEGTLKRIATHLHQATTFVLSNECPKTPPSLSQSHINSTLEWYTNLNGKILASISTTYKAKERGTTLWEVWEATTTKWSKFLAHLKVGLGWNARASHVHPLPWLTHPTLPPSPLCRSTRASGASPSLGSAKRPFWP